jgi:hypothetical protein
MLPDVSLTPILAPSLLAGDLEIFDAGGGHYTLRTKTGVSFDLPAGTQIAITNQD